MLLIPCPWCGLRDESEFDYGGNHIVFPQITDPPTSSVTTWHRVIHLRENTRGNIQELWYHRAGCERWFSVIRNTQTHAFSGASATGPAGASGRDHAG